MTPQITNEAGGTLGGGDPAPRNADRTRERKRRDCATASIPSSKNSERILRISGVASKNYSLPLIATAYSKN